MNPSILLATSYDCWIYLWAYPCKTCSVLICSVFKQLCRSKCDQTSKIKSIENSFKVLERSLQDSQKSRLNYTPQRDKPASAKFSDCLLAIANIWGWFFFFFRFYLSHQALIQAKFCPGRKSSNHAESAGVGYSNINLPMKLHTAV